MEQIKNVLITGATSGIGRACAELFAQKGFRLILTGRRKERLESIKTNLLSKCEGVEILSFDIRNEPECLKALDSLSHDFSDIDILINNAGLASGLDFIHEGDLDDWEKMIDTNIKGLLYITKAVAKQMVGRRSGHIINVGSVAGKFGYAKGAVYVATKHAVEGLTKSMRLDLLPYGIRVSQICPGLVDTEFSEVRFHGDTDRAKQVYHGLEPLHAADIAEGIWFMASRPAHVNISDIWIMPTAQADPYNIKRHEN